MNKSKNNEESLKFPKDIPEDFFDVVSKVLGFIEHVDQEKENK